MSTRTEISAQAAAWISRLNADDRTEAVDAACREWLSANPRHRTAFELANRMWEDASTLPVSLSARIGRPASPGADGKRNHPLYWIAAAGMALIAFAGALLYVQRPQQVLETKTGQQLSVALEDGSRLVLNTNTRARVRFDKHARRIELTSGEALFDVAKDSARPFVVRAGERQITALGTQFVVRHDQIQTAVTLMEGKVSVSGDHAAALLNPGERMTIAPRRPAVVDRPALDAVTAWRKGEIIFENTPLFTAIEEMNRYSARKLKLAATAPAQMPVSGLFRSGDAENFALALTKTHPLEAREHGSDIEIRAR